MAQQEHEQQQLKHERWSLLEQINNLTETPMTMLSFVWLGLLVVDFTQGLSPLLQWVSNIIWALFALDFVIEILIAPYKLEYIRRNWLTVVSLLLPALRIIRIFRVFRLLRAARAVRSVSLIRVVTSLNRGMRAVGKTLGRRGIGYVVALAALVTFGGAAGMYAFESPQALTEAGYLAPGETLPEGVGLASYGEAVWWTAMIMTTMGSEYWPKTAEGRILGWLLAIYAFAIFGYITATIASYFVGQDVAAQQQAGAASTAGSEAATLQSEIVALRQQLDRLTSQLATLSATPGASINEEPAEHRA